MSQDRIRADSSQSRPTWEPVDPILTIVARLGIGAESGVTRSPPLGRAPDVVDALRKSGVPIAAVIEEDHPDLDWLFDAKEYRELLAEHRLRRNEYETEFRAFLEATRSAELPVLIIKACGVFPYESSNLDLLVPPERMPECAELLTSLGFVYLRNYREDHKTLHKKFDKGRGIACFHLHHQVSWVGSVFVSPDAMWRGRQPLPGFEGAWQLDPSRQVEQVIAHAVYEKAAVSLGDLRRVLLRIAEDGVDPGQIAADAAARGWLPGLQLGVRALAAMERASCATRRIADLFDPGSSESPMECEGPTIPLGKWKSRALFVRKILGCRTDPLGERARLLFVYLWSKFHSLTGIPYHRPLLVALSGMDGAGKSYYRTRLHDLLTNCDISVRSIWARGGSTGFLLWLKGVARRSTGPSGPFAVQPSENQLSRSWQRLLWPWVVVLELLGTYLVRVVPLLLVRRIVLCDRHVLDAAVDLSFRLGDENLQARIAWRLFEFLAPRPGLHFLLDVSPQEAARRKDLEVSATRLEERRQRYQTFRSRDVRVIDTERDREEVADELGEILLHAILEEDS